MVTSRKMLVFQVGDQAFGATVEDIREVIPAPEVTALPKAHPPVLGVFNLRGNVVTAVDGAAALGVRRDGGTPSRAVVVDQDDHLFGILVDAASEVTSYDADEVRPATGLGALERGDMSEGIILQGDRPIVLLNLPRILSPGQAETAEAVRRSAT